MPRRVTVGSVPIDALTAQEVVEHVFGSLDRCTGGVLMTPNLDIVRLLRKAHHAAITESADLSVCDGSPLLWAAALEGDPLPERVPGSDLIWSLSEGAALRGRSVFIIGGPPGVAEAALQRLSTRYPGLRAAGQLSPGPRYEHSPRSLVAMRRAVVAAAPDIVFVCLGFPKQERLAMALAPHLPETWFVGCGAAVEFVAGTRRRAPRWLQRRGLEWVHRLAQEPRRLGPRYAKDAIFGIGLLTASAAHGVRRRVRIEQPARRKVGPVVSRLPEQSTAASTGVVDLTAPALLPSAGQQ